MEKGELACLGNGLRAWIPLLGTTTLMVFEYIVPHSHNFVGLQWVNGMAFHSCLDFDRVHMNTNLDRE